MKMSMGILLVTIFFTCGIMDLSVVTKHMDTSLSTYCGLLAGIFMIFMGGAITVFISREKEEVPKTTTNT